MNRQVIVFALVCLTAVVVACSSAPPAPALTVAVPTPTQTSDAAFIADAQKEGKLRFYTTLSNDEAQPLLLRFNQKYPFIQIDYFQGTSAALAQKVVNDEYFGAELPDVVEMAGVEMLQLYNDKLLAPYKSAYAQDYPDAAKHPWGYYTAAHVNAIVIAYNTTLVPAQEVPKSLSDLSNPKWAGKMIVETEDWPLMPFSARVLGDQPASAFWTKLGAMKPRMMRGHVEIANAIARGDAAISPTTDARQVEMLKKKGVPIEWVKTDPVYAYLQSIAILAKSPHPNSARLFVDWLLSSAGQAELGALGHIPVRSGIKPNPPTLTEGVRFYYGDPSQIADANQARLDYYRLFEVR